MKKSVIMLLSVVCVLSVLLVSFLGRTARRREGTIFVESIKVRDYDKAYEMNLDGTKTHCYYKTIYCDENGYARYQINCETVPQNATNNSIRYVNAGSKEGITVNFSTGLVEIWYSEDNGGVAVVDIIPAGNEVLEVPVRMNITAIYNSD